MFPEIICGHVPFVNYAAAPGPARITTMSSETPKPPNSCSSGANRSLAGAIQFPKGRGSNFVQRPSSHVSSNAIGVASFSAAASGILLAADTRFA